MKTGKISYLIITKDRPVLAKRCLKSINHLSVRPNEVVVVEDVSNNQFLNIMMLKTICPAAKHLTYLTTTSKNYSKSRNLALKKTSSDIAVFVDDDVYLPAVFGQKTTNFFLKHPTAAGFAPKVISEKNDFYSRFGEYFFRGNYNSNSFSLTQRAPFCCVALNTRYAKKITFDENTQTGEDVIYMRQLTKLNKHFYYNPDIKVRHQFENKPLKFFLKYFNYGKDLLYISNTLNDKSMINIYFPIRKLQYIFLPLFVFSKSIEWAKKDIKILKDKNFFAPSILHNLGLFVGLYNSIARYNLRRILLPNVQL